MTDQTHTAENDAAYVVDIEWSAPNLPRLVGPFRTRAEAEEWGTLNVVNGTWNVASLAYPYLRSARVTPPGEATP